MLQFADDEQRVVVGRVVCRQVSELGGGGFKARLQGLYVLEGARGLVEDCAARRRQHFLRQIAERDVASLLDAAAVELLLAHDRAQQGRLARAIGAHEPDAVARADQGAHLVKKHLLTKPQGQSIQREHCMKRIKADG
jgi:hypothetical protein